MRICVFCGSNSGNDALYVNAAQEMGRTLAAHNIDLIYGGGRVGLMGALADAALAAGGAVIGVMPRALVEREIQHTGLSELHTVETMHERKTRMAELSEGFIALPGGAGTLEEIFEQWTWAQLGIHHKPCGFLNTNGYFDALRNMIERMTGEGFLRPEHASMLVFDTQPAAILKEFRNYSPPAAKWLRASNAPEPPQTVIPIVAALVQDEAQRVLLVRKRGTRAFMQPGGKMRDSESHLAALERELSEELRCSVRPGSPTFLGTFTAPAANERDCVVEAALYRVELIGPISAASEIDEILWLDPHSPGQIELAPLTREKVLPLAARV
ncbi:MAG TPA: TIGR00730 family Rossman fold protein [Bryobacteraceae bacterium]|nr:TIGR00730 family Rossman fold protein [Bryobacteraceae bacterium]